MHRGQTSTLARLKLAFCTFWPRWLKPEPILVIVAFWSGSTGHGRSFINEMG